MYQWVRICGSRASYIRDDLSVFSCSIWNIRNRPLNRTVNWNLVIASGSPRLDYITSTRWISVGAPDKLHYPPNNLPLQSLIHWIIANQHQHQQMHRCTPGSFCNRSRPDKQNFWMFTIHKNLRTSQCHWCSLKKTKIIKKISLWRCRFFSWFSFRMRKRRHRAKSLLPAIYSVATGIKKEKERQRFGVIRASEHSELWHGERKTRADMLTTNKKSTLLAINAAISYPSLVLDPGEEVRNLYSIPWRKLTLCLLLLQLYSIRTLLYSRGSSFYPHLYAASTR